MVRDRIDLRTITPDPGESRSLRNAEAWVSKGYYLNGYGNKAQKGLCFCNPLKQSEDLAEDVGSLRYVTSSESRDEILRLRETKDRRSQDSQIRTPNGMEQSGQEAC